MPEYGDLTLWALVIGFLSPPILAVIQQPRWNDQLRAVVTFLFAIVLGLGNVYFNGQFSEGHDVVTSILLVLVSAISTYKGFWQKTGIAPTIEHKTSRSDYDRAA